MTQNERPSAGSPPQSHSKADMDDRAFRHVYADTLMQEFLARQARAFRGDQSQAEFGEKIGLKQNAIHRLENPNYSSHTLATLRHAAHELDVVLFVRWVDFKTFLDLTRDLRERDIRPPSYGELRVDNRTDDALAPEALEASVVAGEDSAPISLVAHVDLKIRQQKNHSYVTKPLASGGRGNQVPGARAA